MDTITILGRVPSKKNSVIAMVRGGRVIHIPSNAYREWHKDAIKQIPKVIFKKVSSILIEIYAPDKRKSDLTNKAESIMDLLVDTGVIPDDNWFEVGQVTLKFQGVDKENPRAKITIYGDKE